MCWLKWKPIKPPWNWKAITTVCCCTLGEAGKAAPVDIIGKEGEAFQELLMQHKKKPLLPKSLQKSL